MSGDAVRGYLREVLAADTRAFGAERAELAELRAALEAADAPRWSALAAWRLLASNSLRAEAAPGRAAWDRANAALAEALKTDEPVRFALARRLHAELAPTSAALRTEAVFTADERYLAPEDLPACLEELDLGLAGARDGLEAAFRAYVGVVTVHPFSNGNGRTARLFADYALMREAWLPLCFASPIASHVARTYGGAARDVPSAFAVFAAGIANAYRAVLGAERDR